MDSPYCQSLVRTLRRPTREVRVGNVAVGGMNPIRIQSMTTSDTKDVAATVAEAVGLAEAGCEIIRVTAPNVTAAKCLKPIREELTRLGVHAPLVADIHFLPAAALEAVEHVEKVRINPGNYADRKKFAVREYSDTQYDEELQRLYDSFSPLVKRCKELGRSMRIGTNHGSLSDRIMNRYGDTPLGMVESALEFLRIAESHGYREIILSMKSSNPKVMIQAYRLLVHRMELEDMHYPLHLGVTEAGDGEDGRIKSAIGIGSLLADGLGDTIRVSLTEDSIHEIPVAEAIARQTEALWRIADQNGAVMDEPEPDRYIETPFAFSRREAIRTSFGQNLDIGAAEPPRVLAHLGNAESADFEKLLSGAGTALKENPLEGVVIDVSDIKRLPDIAEAIKNFPATVSAIVLSLPENCDWSAVDLLPFDPDSGRRWVLMRRVDADSPELDEFLEAAKRNRAAAALDVDPAALPSILSRLRRAHDKGLPIIFTASVSRPPSHAIGAYRQIAACLNEFSLAAPIWIRSTRFNAAKTPDSFLNILLNASILQGSLLCDGIGDLVSIETEPDPVRAVKLTYNVLQGAGARISKTEFVACPSCGRTLFNLQSTTQRIREKTSHLRGVKIAIMGCIVNGPGEMADADFGYVGGAPGRVNLYVGKECVEFHVPEADADSRLIELIKSRGKWFDA